MALKFTGDFETLERFALKLDQAGGQLRTINLHLAEETIELIREGFERGEDPSGKQWEPIKLRSGQPLRDTGGLQSSWHRENVTSDGFSVASGKNYAIFHQSGTGIYGPHKKRIKPVRAKALNIPGVGPRASVAGSPARKMVPDPGPLPSKWRERYIDTAAEILTHLFEGK